MEHPNEIILYQPEETVKIEVRFDEDTVWLTQRQMAELFNVKEHTINYHIKEIYQSEELTQNPTTRKIRVVRKEGNRLITRHLDFYNLDMIISVGNGISHRRIRQGPRQTVVRLQQNAVGCGGIAGETKSPVHHRADRSPTAAGRRTIQERR